MSDLTPPPFNHPSLGSPPPSRGEKFKEFFRRFRSKLSGLAGKSRTRFSELKSQDVRDRLKESMNKFRSFEWARSLPQKLQELEPQAVADWANRTFQRQNVGGYGKAATIIICSFFMADLAALFVGNYIPEPPVPRGGGFRQAPRRAKTIDDYNVIFARNLFNSKGIIPGEEQNPGAPDINAPPVKTSLPFNLVGTLVMRDELRSIATIEDRSANLTYPVRVEDEIPTKARILKIEATRVIFVNTSSGRKEFVELPEENANIPKITVGSPTAKGPGIERVAPTQFNIARTEIDKTFADLNNVLTQARCVPALENGQSVGFRCFQIVPGSIYDKLGMVNNDIITCINDQPLSDPGQAVSLLSSLKESSHISLCIKRNGRNMNMAYDIR